MKKRINTAMLTLIVSMSAWALETVDGIYQIGSAADLNEFAELVNSGTTDANAVLTANIDNYAGAMIGTVETYYAGTFDGRYHTINCALEATEMRCALFRSLSGTVRNLNMTGTITSSFQKVGGIACYLYGGTIENCVSSINIISTFNGDGGCGGIISTSGLPGGVIKNCVFAGSIQGANTENSGGIAAWITSTSDLALTNCLVIGDISTKVSDGNTFTRNWGRATRTNCYYLNAHGSVQSDTKKVTQEQLASGEVCYLLNGDQTNIQWTQKIDEENKPTPFPTGKQVYAVPSEGYRCDGTPQGETTYSNTDPQIAVPAHTFTDGICQVCGTPDLDYIKPNAEGFYELKSENDMRWFATRVNNGEKLNAVLTADIDMTGLPTCMIGISQGKPFTGVFDGQGHTIKLAINVANTGNFSGSLFRFVKDATFRNLRLTGSVTTRGKHPASLVSAAAGKVLLEKVISNCDIYTNASDACMGGLVGLAGENDNGFAADVTFDNCAFTGTITHTGDASQNHGGLFVGWKGNKNASVTVRNSFTAVKSITNSAKFGTFVRVWASTDNGRTSFENCFYINDISEWLTKQGTEKTAEEFAGGAVCSLLGGNFRQTIGEDTYPVLDQTHGIVKKIGSTGYATMYQPENSVTIPAGVEAYTGIIWNNLLGLNPVQNVVSKGQAVVLKGNAGYYSFLPSDAGLGLIQSDLLGTAEPLETNGSQYVLAEKDGVVGFYKAEGTIPAGKAYIEYAGAASVKGFALEGATGIDLTPALSQGEGASAIYDLSGRRVEKGTKGIYIVNGKKVMK